MTLIDLGFAFSPTKKNSLRQGIIKELTARVK